MYRPILAAAAVCALGAALGAGAVYRGAPCPGSVATESLQEKKPGPTCLDRACHGPFEKLASREPWYALPDGTRINPHMYEPHDMRAEINIPRCPSCHEVHALPRPAGVRRQADIEACYRECHHARNLKPCKECHKR